MIRVVVADDHPLFREGIASLLKRTPDIELVGEVATGEQATLLAKDLLPDDESVFAAVRAGGRGYVLKDADPEGLLRAIRAVVEGEVLLGAGVALRVLQQFAAVEDRAQAIVRARDAGLGLPSA